MNKASTLPKLIALAAVACFIISVSHQRTAAQATTFTISGTVTNTTGQGLADVAVILVSDATGTQIALTNQNGTYVLTYAGGVSHSLSVRAAKSGFVFNPLSITFISVGGSLSGNETVNFSGTASPIPLPILQMPILLTQENSLQALTLDSVTWMSEPFGVTNTNNFSADQRTRLTLLAANIELLPGESITSAIEAQAETSTQIFPLNVEHFGPAPNFPWLKQVVVKLPNEIANSNEVRVSLKVHGTDGNKVIVKVKP